MSDCSTSAMKPKELPKTCGTCGISVSEIQKITGCHYQQGIELYNRILERDNDKLEQLEQVARELLGVIEQIRQPIDPVLDVVVERSKEALGVEACPFCGGEDGKHSESCYITMSKENV